MFRCGAHLLNLALGSTRIAQSSVGSNLVQVVTSFGKFRVVFQPPDAVLSRTGRGGQFSSAARVSALTTGRGPCEDRTQWSVQFRG
jgi:hypothetical protein